MKRLLLLILLSLFSVPANAQAEEPDPLSFFPHHVGDIRVYLYEGSSIARAVITNIEVDAESNIWIYEDEASLPSYKITSDYNVYSSPMGSNYLKYKLTAENGETWIAKSFNDGISIHARVNNVYQSFVFGQHIMIKEIAYFEVQPPDTTINEKASYHYTQLLASGFGFIRQLGESGDVPIDLIGCIIGGETFGTVTNVEEEQRTSAVQAFPNPCNTFTTIHRTWSVHGTSARIEILDIFGRIVHSADIQTNSYTLNTSTFPDGIYFCRVTAGTHTATQKLIVQR